MPDPEQADLAEFQELGDIEALQKVNERLQRQLRDAKHKTMDLVDAVYEGAKDATTSAGRAQKIASPKRDSRKKRAEVAWVVCTDWHFGKQSPTFDRKVAADRVRAYAQKVEEMTAIERADHPVDECHVLFVGDFTEGLGIFPGQAYEVDGTLFEHMMSAARTAEEFLQHMLRIFPTVHVWCQTGNHGRIGKRGDMPRGDNTDRLLYRIVADRLTGQDDKRLVWHMPTNWYTICQTGNYKALLIHGDQIKSFGGTPVFAILKKANSWASGVIPTFRDVYMGHFHVDLKLSLANGVGKVFVSPSIESDSAFAAEVVAAAGSPAQRLCFVDPHRGRVTTERLIWLAEDGVR